MNLDCFYILFDFTYTYYCFVNITEQKVYVYCILCKKMKNIKSLCKMKLLNINFKTITKKYFLIVMYLLLFKRHISTKRTFYIINMH